MELVALVRDLVMGLELDSDASASPAYFCPFNSGLKMSGTNMTEDYLLYLDLRTGDSSVVDAGLLEMKLSEKSVVEAAPSAAAAGV